MPLFYAIAGWLAKPGVLTTLRLLFAKIRVSECYGGILRQLSIFGILRAVLEQRNNGYVTHSFLCFEGRSPTRA
jgi:hypothetical protein